MFGKKDQAVVGDEELNRRAADASVETEWSSERRGRGGADRDIDLRGVDVRDRFGGIDLAGILGGMFAALGVLLLLAVVATAAGIAGSGADGVATRDLTIAGLATAAAIIAVACLVGGWVAGRASRYDGAGNGVLTALGFLILLGLSVGAGGSTVTDTDGLLGTDLLRGYDGTDVGWAALGAGAGLLTVGLLAGALGGRIGDGYHRKVDSVLGDSRVERLAHPVEVDGISGDRDRAVRSRGDMDLERTRQRESGGSHRMR